MIRAFVRWLFPVQQASLGGLLAGSVNPSGGGSLVDDFGTKLVDDTGKTLTAN